MNQNCLLLLTWAAKGFAPTAYQLTPLHWDEVENGSIQPSLNCSSILHRLRLLFHRICIYALILLVSALGSYDKHAVTWFLINNGIQGMVEYNAFNMKLNIIQWFPCFSLVMQEKGPGGGYSHMGADGVSGPDSYQPNQFL